MRKFMSFGTGLLLGVILTGTWFMSNTAANSPTRATATAAINALEMTINARDLPIHGDADAF